MTRCGTHFCEKIQTFAAKIASSSFSFLNLLPLRLFLRRNSHFQSFVLLNLKNSDFFLQINSTAALLLKLKYFWHYSFIYVHFLLSIWRLSGLLSNTEAMAYVWRLLLIRRNSFTSRIWLSDVQIISLSNPLFVVPRIRRVA